MGSAGQILSSIPLVGGLLGSIVGYNPAEEQMKFQANQQSNLMSQQTAANQAAVQQQQQFWKENAFPSTDAVTAMKKSGLSDMNAQSQMAQKNFLESASARGIQGGGAVQSGLSAIERQRQQSYGGLLNNLTQFANKPQFAPSYSNNPSGLLGTSGGTGQQTDYLSQGLGSGLGMLGGMAGYNALMGGGTAAGAAAGTGELATLLPESAFIFGDMMQTPSLGQLSIKQIMAMKDME